MELNPWNSLPLRMNPTSTYNIRILKPLRWFRNLNFIYVPSLYCTVLRIRSWSDRRPSHRVPSQSFYYSYISGPIVSNICSMPLDSRSHSCCVFFLSILWPSNGVSIRYMCCWDWWDEPFGVEEIECFLWSRYFYEISMRTISTFGILLFRND